MSSFHLHRALWQEQGSSNRNRQRPGNAHRVILLQPRDRLTNLGRKISVYSSAIITQAAQRSLQCTDVSRLQGEVATGLKIIQRPPMVAWFEVCRVWPRTLMQR